MPYYFKDPKRDPDFDNHPYTFGAQIPTAMVLGPFGLSAEGRTWHQGKGVSQIPGFPEMQGDVVPS